MNEPDLFLDWCHDAVHQLQEKNERLATEFRLGSWPRYDFDLEAGTLIFSEHDVPKVIAEIQIVGTISAKSGDWLWAWANSHLPPERVEDSRLVRAFGEERRIPQLIEERVRDDDINALGWELTAIMVRLTDAPGAYRPPRQEGGGVYMIYKSMTWAS